MPAGPQLTPRQRLAYDYVCAAGNDGVTADEIGAWLHVNRTSMPHGIDERCQWCARDALSVLRSKAVAPLVTYRRRSSPRFYIARDPKDRVRVVELRRQPTAAELAADPFAGL